MRLRLKSWQYLSCILIRGSPVENSVRNNKLLSVALTVALNFIFTQNLNIGESHAATSIKKAKVCLADAFYTASINSCINSLQSSGNTVIAISSNDSDSRSDHQVIVLGQK